jgi:hypothetical protein
MSVVAVPGLKPLPCSFPPEPIFVKAFGCSGARGPVRLGKAFKLNVASGSASLIVSAWSRHACSRLCVYLYGEDTYGGKRCLTATVAQATSQRRLHSAVSSAVCRCWGLVQSSKPPDTNSPSAGPFSLNQDPCLSPFRMPMDRCCPRT